MAVLNFIKIVVDTKRETAYFYHVVMTSSSSSTHSSSSCIHNLSPPHTISFFSVSHKSTYDDIAEIASGFVCESSSDDSVSFSIREASTDEIFGAIEFESNSKTSEEEQEKEEEDTWFAVRVNKSGFSIQNSEKNSEESESSSLRSSILSSSIIAVGEDAKNAMQKPNVSLVKNLSSLLSVLGVLDRT